MPPEKATLSPHWWVNEIKREGLRKPIDAVVVMGHAHGPENHSRVAVAAQLFWQYPFTHVVLTGSVKQMNEAQHYLFTHFVPSESVVRIHAKTTFDQVQNAKHWGREQFDAGNPVNRLVFIAHETELQNAQVGHDFTTDIPGCKCEFQSTKSPSFHSKVDPTAMVNKTAVALFPFLYVTNSRQEQSFHSSQLSGIKLGNKKEETGKKA